MDAAPLPFPALFVSHGSPMLALEPGPAGAFMRRLGPTLEARFGRPRAILALSPHSSTREPTLLTATRHPAVHDFSGFPEALYRLRYEPAGAPELAETLATALAAQGLQVARREAGGLDHGVWSVLRFAWPEADRPVLPLTLPAEATPATLQALGAALAPALAEHGVLLLASGSLTHNLRLLFGPQGWLPQDAPEQAGTRAFRDWVQARVAAGDEAGLRDYRRLAPAAREQHPTDEHWLPFYLAMGAGGLQDAARLHAGVDHGALAMDSYAFGPGAAALAAALH
ncbi:DODA-type extradiol aromatic ring-opening family dioxygenase [Aquariibacter albus]|uniref:Dioxygenase n=1 Tax=Aquariibacter albus TaxID=2759899 RepID=A0A839HIK9_9BURK|nr:class III extradiol ring-cleavage dioxygenase [Aquariibacter albus]MBB1161713.1 dioxygenase [Aquariibacter albus]